MPKERTTKEITKRTVKNYYMINDRLIYKPTGEVIDNISMILDYITMTQETKGSSDVKEIMYINKWMSHNRFTKLYHNTSLDCVSVGSLGLLFIFATNLIKSSNEVMINNARPTNKVLASLCRVNVKTIERMLSELEKVNAIKRIGKTNNRIILVNPSLCFNGSNLLGLTCKLFEG